MTTADVASTTLARFDHAWESLDKTVQSLDARKLTDVRDPAGWSAKDHLMHVAVWEEALHAYADGRPRHQVLGLDPSTEGSEDWDTMNAAIFARTRHEPLADVLGALRRTHDRTRARLLAIVAAGPDAETAEPARTFLSKLPGFIEHYDQHHGWIRDLVGGR